VVAFVGVGGAESAPFGSFVLDRLWAAGGE
jgi:hypothetical protein